MRLRALLETESLGFRLLGGAGETDRTVRAVMTTDLRDPSRYLSGGELVLSGLAWRHGPKDSERFVQILADARVTALAAGEAEGPVPEDLVTACARHGMPLLSVSEDVAFATITEHVMRQVSAERADDLAAVVERHRRLMASGPSGGGPDVVLDLLGADLDLRAWVLTPTGRTVAGPGDGNGNDTDLPGGAGPQLARAHLEAERARRPAPHRASAAGSPFALLPVRSGPDGGLSDWLLAVEGDADEWPAERLDLLEGVARLIAVERDRRDAARTVGRRLAQEVLELLQSGAQPPEIEARLRATTPALLPGPAPRWQVVVAALEDEEDGGRAHGPAARALLEEALLDPRASGPDASDRIAVGYAGDEAVALVPVPAPGDDGEPAGGDGDGISAVALLETVREPLEAGLGTGGRLTFGVSAVVHSAEGLRGALEEARHARRVAAARPERVCAAGHEELASHVLLLPFVPDDVRRAFTARLLAPLHDYDRKHRAELVDTLEAFLGADGSWTRCAARLHVHVNTLRYRIGRIEQLTGRDLARLEDRLDFFLALRMS